MNGISSDFSTDEFNLFSTDYLAEDEDICDYCGEVKSTNELEVVPVNEQGAESIICDECVDNVPDA